ncbi:HTH-type transcriptional regulator BenM [Streptomyces hundungensis]|uniref:HTH-type transcriptional regulator BenM n=1 Tax=Streptomyces hundungensis TaxID=1077946 RepID=A0A387H434_9ACTN|nr:LysR substrate-binding domain-containing protein [Streptomyces hundungensis]AYG78446.1 HTH-type transcriptional regulator BenM [Streptomyces hundungensis]
MMPEARLLRYFLAVAEETSFTRAAARLHIAQPALSAQIRLLESRLGVRLLFRTTRVVRLTDAGRAVQERGAAALAALDDVWDAAQRAGRGELGRLRLVYSASTGYGTVPELVEAVRREYPEIQVSAEVLSTPDIAHAVLDGRADAGVARAAEPVPGVRLRPVRRERRGILVSREHPLAATPDGCGVTLAAVARFPVLVHGREANPGHYDGLLGLFRQAEIEPRLTERSVSFDPTQRPLRDGDAVGLVGEAVGQDQPDWLRWMPLTGVPPLEAQLVLPEVAVTPTAARFEEAAVATARQRGWIEE